MKSHLSLRMRFGLGLCAVLLPFLLTAAVGQFYLLPRLLEPFEDVIREYTEEMEPVEQLQKSLLMAAMPVNDYLIHGEVEERERFAQLRQRVERAFEDASPERFTLEQERDLIGSARWEWEQALRLGEQLLRLPEPVGNAAAARTMKRFDAHIDQAVAQLEEAHGIFHRVIDEDRAQARTARHGATFLTVGAFVLAFGISLLVSVLLARRLLKGFDVLRSAAERLSSGDRSARAVLDRKDELGQLTRVFNIMADKLERDQQTLENMATHDGLTCLYNHRMFHTLLEEELARAKRFNHPVSLLMLDIDHFKHVNDTHGHQAGDAILKGLSDLLVRQARAIDRVCRYGGEEITLILPETDVNGAINIAERLRTAVEQEPFDVGSGRTIHITVSIGAASYPAHATSGEALVSAADTAMYAAKQGGRNRVARYEPSMNGENSSR